MVDQMQIGVRVPPCRPAHELATFATTIEAAGFDTLYVPDSQTLWRDAFLTLYASALQTSRLQLATAVSNVVTRHPSVVAGLARSIDEVAPGRFVIGLMARIGWGSPRLVTVDLGDAFRQHARDGVLRVASKYFGRLTTGSVHVTREGVSYRCTVVMQAGALKTMTGEATDKEMAMAKLLIEQLAGDFEADDYEDDYRR